LFTAGFGQHSLATNITLLRSAEVDDIIENGGERFKDVGVSSDVSVIKRYFKNIYFYLFIEIYHVMSVLHQRLTLTFQINESFGLPTFQIKQSECK